MAHSSLKELQSDTQDSLKVTIKETHVDDIDSLIRSSLLLEKKSFQVTLEMMILNYIFNKDDGKLSRNEIKTIRKHYSLYKNRITKDAKEDIQDISKRVIELTDIIKHIVDHNLKRELVKQSFEQISKIGDSENYISLVKDLKLYIYSVLHE